MNATIHSRARTTFCATLITIIALPCKDCLPDLLKFADLIVVLLQALAQTAWEGTSARELKDIQVTLRTMIKKREIVQRKSKTKDKVINLAPYLPLLLPLLLLLLHHRPTLVHLSPLVLPLLFQDLGLTPHASADET